MAQIRSRPTGNRILDRLPPLERSAIGAVLEAIEFEPGQLVCGAGRKIRHVYFPRHGAVSLFAKAAGAAYVGAGLVHAHGMFGLGAAAGPTTSRLRAESQGHGGGNRIEADAFRQVLRRCPALGLSLLGYADTFAAQGAQNTACMAHHAAGMRLARWMLDLTEATGGADLSATQEDIATVLGIRRAAVSHAASPLQGSGLIRYVRGEMTILDRPRLRAMACDCSIRF